MYSAVHLMVLIVSTAIGVLAGSIDTGKLFYFFFLKSLTISCHETPRQMWRSQFCRANPDDTGEMDEQVTKDCCVCHQTTGVVEKQCRPYSGHFGNIANTGKMTKRCGGRGCGSQQTCHLDEVKRGVIM